MTSPRPKTSKSPIGVRWHKTINWGKIYEPPDTDKNSNCGHDLFFNCLHHEHEGRLQEAIVALKLLEISRKKSNKYDDDYIHCRPNNFDTAT